MYKPNENDIDRISREAAERYNAPGTPAWDVLQQTLDKELPQEKEKKRRGFFFFFLLLGLILTGSTVWYGISRNNKPTGIAADNGSTPSGKQSVLKNNNPVSNNNTSIAAENNILKTEAPVNETRPEGNAPAASKANASPLANNNADNSTTPTVADKKSNAAIVKSASTTNSNIIVAAEKTSTTAVKTNTRLRNDKNATTLAAAGGSRKLLQTKTSLRKKPGAIKTMDDNIVTAADDNRTTRNKTPRKNQPVDVAATETNDEANNLENAGTVSLTKNKQPKGKRNTVTANSTSIITKAIANSEERKEEAGTTIKNTGPQATTAVIDTAAKAVTAPEIVAEKQVAVAESKDSAKTATAKKLPRKAKNEKAIFFGLTGGLDESTIKFTYGSGIGYNIGLMGGYQFSKHLSVYTGLVYTKKNYKLAGSDYHPPKHYWTQYVNLQTVDGYCRMWEVPLQLRYTFNPSAKTPLFASAGLSSYFMKKQSYDYAYKTNTGMPGSATWGTDSTFNHAFSILDLSVGFEKRLGKHMNWQFEPYAKIPLGGLGFGSIRMSSFGINLTVQYRKTLKR